MGWGQEVSFWTQWDTWEELGTGARKDGTKTLLLLGTALWSLLSNAPPPPPAAGASSLHHLPDLLEGQGVSPHQDSAAYPSCRLLGGTKRGRWDEQVQRGGSDSPLPLIPEKGALILLPANSPWSVFPHQAQALGKGRPHPLATFSGWQVFVHSIIALPVSSPERAQGGQWGWGAGLLILRRQGGQFLHA